MGCHRSDLDCSACLPDSSQTRNFREIDEILRSGEPELHQGNQAVPAGEHLGVVLVRSQERGCLGQRGRSDVLKRAGDHGETLLKNSVMQIPVHLVAVRTRQTFSGVAGMSMCRMPVADSASTTALITAG